MVMQSPLYARSESPLERLFCSVPKYCSRCGRIISGSAMVTMDADQAYVDYVCPDCGVKLRVGVHEEHLDGRGG